MEFFTFVDNYLLRVNISLSATGSTLYILGSIGWFPQVMDVSQALGVWGFILGSLFIAVSQAWKVHRIGSIGEVRDGFHIDNILVSTEQFTAAGVEAGAGIGASCFFVGTAMYGAGFPDFDLVLWIWIVGSVSFTAGSLFLGYRHAVLRL